MGNLEKAGGLRVSRHKRRVDSGNRARKTDRSDAIAGHGHRENGVVVEDEILNRFRSVRCKSGARGKACEEDGVSEWFHI